MRRSVALLLAGLAASCSWGGSSSNQKVAVSSLHDLRLRDDIATVKPAFEGWKTIAEGGIHLESGDPMPDEVLDMYTRGEMLEDRLHVRVTLYRTAGAAAQSFWRDCASFDRDGTNRVFGEGADRACIGIVRESESRCVWVGPRGMGTYISNVAFLKGRVKIHIYESAPTPEAAKDPLIRELAERLRPFGRE